MHPRSSCTCARHASTVTMHPPSVSTRRMPALAPSFLFQGDLCKDGEEIIRRDGIAWSADRHGNIEFAVIDRHININRGTQSACPGRTRVNVHIEYQLHMVDIGRRLIDP